MTARPPLVHALGGRAFTSAQQTVILVPHWTRSFPSNDYENLIRLVHDSFDGMKKTCQWIALFLTQNPNDVAVNSANATAERSGYHASVTDPEARLYKKSPGSGATPCFMGHSLTENRNGLIV